MYTAYWGLKEKPFENTPDPKFVYYSQQHEEAMARMLYVVREHKGAALLTGEYGCGKTLLSRLLKAELQAENKYQAVFVLDPRLSGIEFLQEIAYQLGGGPITQTKIEVSHLLNKLLCANRQSSRHTVVVIDEAQSIKNPDIFEELRLLLNFQLDNAFLLTIILLGSSELKFMVASMPQLVQRMSVRYHINGLNEWETREYINHRLKIAGASRQLFAEDSCHQIYLCTYGVPRRINTLCDLALLVGFSNKLKIIDKQTVLDINEDMELPKSEIEHIYQPSGMPFQPGISGANNSTNHML